MGSWTFYPYVGHAAQYGKSAGTLLGAEPIVVKDAVEQVAPKSATFRIPGGDKQVLLVFTKPNDTKEYAVPVGYRQDGQYTFYTDEIFFYDDPHELYKHWGPEIWKAVDAHEVILGMNERQVELSLGQVSQSTSKDYGNRMVVFANMGKPMAVTFVKNKVTAFRPDQGFLISSRMEGKDRKGSSMSSLFCLRFLRCNQCLTTEIVSVLGYCAEWWMAVWATTPVVSS